MRIYRVEVYDAWSDKIDAIDLDADGVVAELNDVIRRELIEEDVYLKYFNNRAAAEACSRSVRKELEEA
jgi:hypothetical protein